MTLATRVAALGLLAMLLVGCAPATPSAAPTPDVTIAAATPTAPIVTAAPTPTEVPTPTPGPTAAAGVPGCGPADLKASHGLSDGAAGSILTEIVLEPAITCSLAATPSLGLQDKAGGTVVAPTAAGPGTIELAGGSAYTSQIRFANWCDPDPAFPLALVLWIDGDKLVVSGGSFPEDGGMPGCLGVGGARLEATPWTVSP